MQAIMLAAGKGSRLGKYTNNNTKCMLIINEKTLLERAIDSLVESNINRLILVLGYKKDNVIQYIKEKELDKKIEIVYIINEDYEKTNNIYSLFLAIDEFSKDDTILLESDIIYEKKIIKLLVADKEKNLAVVSKYADWMDGTVVKIDEQKNITDFIDKSKFNYNEIDLYYKTVNIYKFSKEYINNYYIPFLHAYIKSYGKIVYYELVLKVIAGIESSKIKALPIKDITWYEIDDCQDLEIAKDLFSNNIDKLKGLEKRYGGYWRFKDLKDYCYLVNPYFPTTNIINKMKKEFEMLLSNYPSALKVQNRIMSRFFSVDEEKIIVGNGAAELINNLKHVVKGKIGIHIPSFNEYIRCFPKNEIIKIEAITNDFKYNKNEIKKMVDAVDSLVLINPDNPTGSFLKYEDLIEIIEIYNNKGKYIIIDESFIDFAEKDIRYSLINDELLEKYPHLIVIKSISKSYGVPGLRLGVLATSNINVLTTIKNNMPVWNINSFAEYFLQIFMPYQKEYNTSCDKIAEERNRLINSLRKIPNIKIYDSQANYIMVELLQHSADFITMSMLEKYNILIKNLSTKDGFHNKNYIRLAVKGREDNELLTEALTELLSINL